MQAIDEKTAAYDTLTELTKQLDEVRTELIRKNEIVDALTAEIQALQSQPMIKSDIEAVSYLRQENASLVKERTQLTDSNREKSEEIALLKTSVRELQQKLTVASHENKRFREEIDQIGASASVYEAERQSIEDQNVELSER